MPSAISNSLQAIRLPLQSNEFVMKILVVGSGGREHALAWKLRQSPHAERIFCAPGNAGTAEIAENVAIPASDLEALVRFAKENRILLPQGLSIFLLLKNCAHLVLRNRRHALRRPKFSQNS